MRLRVLVVTALTIVCSQAEITWFRCKGSDASDRTHAHEQQIEIKEAHVRKIQLQQQRSQMDKLLLGHLLREGHVNVKAGQSKVAEVSTQELGTSTCI